MVKIRILASQKTCHCPISRDDGYKLAVLRTSLIVAFQRKAALWLQRDLKSLKMRGSSAFMKIGTVGSLLSAQSDRFRKPAITCLKHPSSDRWTILHS
uniref:Uncharacterized protein n=1 Tax=Oscillatoriales cyanobacterium SpSt-402 TaxID=2282168 RepID=A0A832H4T7_9CYAN